MLNRWKSASIHLAISLAFGGTIAALAYFLWFPPPYFAAAGASTLLIVLMGVDIGVGPLLTLIVVDPRKPKHLLQMDLLVIAAIQSCAFAYGVYIIATARPLFVVAAIDRLVLVASSDVSDSDLAKGKSSLFRTRSWLGPVLVGALPPPGADGIQIALQTMRGGKDVDRLPQFYVPYHEVIDKVIVHGKPLSAVKSTTHAQRMKLEQVNRSACGPAVALPLQRGDQSFTIILCAHTKRPLSIMAIDPW